MRRWGRWRHEISQNGLQAAKPSSLSPPKSAVAQPPRRSATEFFNGIGANPKHRNIVLHVRFPRTSGLIGERVTKILSGPGSLRRHQLNFPIALARAIPLNVWKLGLAPISRQYRTKSSAPTSIKMTPHPVLCQFAISFAWRKSHFSYESAGWLPKRAVRMALHAKERQLARHGGVRTRRSGHPMPQPPHSR